MATRLRRTLQMRGRYLAAGMLSSADVLRPTPLPNELRTAYICEFCKQEYSLHDGKDHAPDCEWVLAQKQKLS